MTSKERLTETIKNSPRFWWVRPFYDSPLLGNGLRVTYNYIGKMPDLAKCADQVRAALVNEMESWTEDEFENHPNVRLKVGPLKVFFYVGGPGTNKPPD